MADLSLFYIIIMEIFVLIEKNRSRKGESKYCQVHEFTRPFFSHMANIKVTSVTGHVYCRDFPKNYSDWYKTDPFS